MQKSWCVIVLFSCLSFALPEVRAVCLEGHPSVQIEYKESGFVGVGETIEKKDFSRPDDPNGIAYSIYRFRFSKIMKGADFREVSIYSENTSSRFPLDAGVPYVVFLQKGSDGLYIDSCGNSGEFKERKTVLREISKF